MTTKEKIGLGIGAIILGYLLWSNHQVHLAKKRKQATANNV